MALSSNSLIHFTSDKENLKGILENNFKIFNCRESIVLGGLMTSWIIPMISFCDIPLSEVKDHINKYGNYGIGLTKEWAVRQGLNPVLYMAQTSMLSDSYRKAWNKSVDDSEDDDVWGEDERCFSDVLRYIKNYEGDLVRKGTTVKNYRFSDEREWRYAPPHSDEYEFLVASGWYDQDDNKFNTDKKLENLRLPFEPGDIKYIIIDNDAEIGDFIDHLRRAKGKNYSLHEIERLTTRILTTEQIMGDI
jgi:hypothetical protein